MRAQVNVRPDDAAVHRRAGELLAVLLNPVDHDRRTTTVRNVEIAASMLGCDGLRLANINDSPTRDLPALSRAAASPASWLAARPALRALLERPGPLLFAWGMGGLTGSARQHWQRQVAWVTAVALEVGRHDAFQMDGRPRHPSRWRQYLGPQHGRHATGATFEDRLRLALQPVPLTR